MEEHTEWEKVELNAWPKDLHINDWGVKTITHYMDFEEAEKKLPVFKKLLPENERIYRSGTCLIVLKRK